MSTRIISQRRDPLETLERILNKTTLTTQRVTHCNIIDVGDKLLAQKHENTGEEQARAIAEAVEAVTIQHEKEMQQAVEQLAQEAEQDKQMALDALKQNLEELAARVADERQKAEEKRVNKLRSEWEDELTAQLEMQRIKMEKIQEQAVTDAVNCLRSQLGREFALAKEIEVAAALAKARERFKLREQESVAKTKHECEAIMSSERERLKQLHTIEIENLQQQLEVLQLQYNKEVERRQQVELDFRDLQDDYRRFLDNTQGRFHSDYMMHLRSYGSNLSADSSDAQTAPVKTKPRNKIKPQLKSTLVK